jgi:hypothetical protein
MSAGSCATSAPRATNGPATVAQLDDSRAKRAKLRAAQAFSAFFQARERLAMAERELPHLEALEKSPEAATSQAKREAASAHEKTAQLEAERSRVKQLAELCQKLKGAQLTPPPGSPSTR